LPSAQSEKIFALLEIKVGEIATSINQSTTHCHAVNSHKVNCHQINLHKIYY